MTRVVLLLATVSLQGCDLREAFSANVDTVARAQGQALPVAAMVDLMTNAKALPLRRDVVEGLADIWVDYTLFADRMVAGDSLLDSAWVVTAQWPEVQQALADRFHAHLVRAVSVLDSAQVDSIYRAGEVRLIRHILYRVNPEAAPAERDAQRQAAEALLARLRDGRVDWETASAESEEPGGPERQGSLGVIGRGEMVARFDDAAYGLAPGALSDVVETNFGYHIIFRPALAEVRAVFAEGARSRAEADFDSAYLDALPGRWDLEVRDDAAETVRALVADLRRGRDSRAVLGTWRDGGRFRGADFVRWLQGLDPQIRSTIGGGSDEQLVALTQSLMRNEVLLAEARAAGITLAPEDLARLRSDLSRELALLRAAMGLMPDTLAMVMALPPAAQRATVQRHIVDYLRALGNNERRFQLVPPFLAERLRDEGDWEIMPAGVERAFQGAQERRAPPDSARVPIPAPPDSVIRS